MKIDYEKLYKAVSDAEHGALTPDEKRWIRTKYAPKEGSSAYGAVQIGPKASDYAKRGFLSPESKEFVEKDYTPMQKLMLTYGKEPKKKGYDKDYDYGGSGKFPVEKREAYKKMAVELMAKDMTDAGNDTDKFLEKWRGVPKKKDPEYWNRFYGSYNPKPKNKWPS